MKRLIAQWLSDARRWDLIILALWAGATVLNVGSDPRTLIAYVMALNALAQVTSLHVELKRAKRLPPNSALAGITQVRTVLINEGNSPEQATELITAWLRSAQNP
jgi:hypothetical protein